MNTNIVFQDENTELKDKDEAEFSKAVGAASESEEAKYPDYVVVVSYMHDGKLLGCANAFKRADHVPKTQIGYFKPENNAFMVEMKAKDRRSAEDWVYVNGAGVWLETGLTTMEIDLETGGSVEDLGDRLVFAEKYFRAAIEVLSIPAQYFGDIVEKGVEEAMQMEFLVEQGHNAVHSSSCNATHVAITSKLEVEVAKQIARLGLERVSKKRRKDKAGDEEEAGEAELV